MAERVSQANEGPINQAALEWLKDANADAPEHHLHVLNLEDWGLEHGAQGDWPERERHALQAQVEAMFAWAPENVRAFLLTNPEGPDRAEQFSNLTRALMKANNPQQAAAFVL